MKNADFTVNQDGQDAHATGFFEGKNRSAGVPPATDVAQYEFRQQHPLYSTQPTS
ncbi:MAG: hypothetical protein AAGG51_06630 [Cyanobacteria bacterium P01_G01_bin.54]